MQQMGRVAVLLILMFASTPSISSNGSGKELSTEQPTPLIVESFNIRLDTQSDGINAWPQRKHLALTHIQQFKPDVVGMQEVLHHQLIWLDEQLPSYTFIGVGRDDGKAAGEYVPLMYNTQTLTKLDSGYFWLSETPNVAGSIGWLAKLPRIVTWGKFSHNNNVFYVFNAHFSHVSDLARQKSAEFLIKHIPTISGEAPVILLGDFNTLDSDPAYSTLMADPTLQFTDAALTGRNKPSYTFNGFGRNDSDRIDYIFTSRGLSSSSYQTHKIREGERFISDHYPISAEVVFEPIK